MESDFYQNRGLPPPAAERRPADRTELRACLARAGPDDPPRALIGAGEHLRRSPLQARAYVAVRTTRVDRILEVDRHSGTVRVEAGCRWGQFRDRLYEEGLSPRRFRLHFSEATVGGLLARRHPLEPDRRAGELSQGCISLSTTDPLEGDYDYLPAPRKASGPDFRFLYIGGEGAFGAILDATFVTPPEQPARLVEFSAAGVRSAHRIYDQIRGLGLRPSWTYWDRSSAVLRTALHGPEGLLDSRMARLDDACDGRFQTGDGADVRAARIELEQHHPRRRSAPTSDRAVTGVWTHDGLARALDESNVELEELALFGWSPRRVRALAVPAEKGRALEELAGAALETDLQTASPTPRPDWTSHIERQLDPEDTFVFASR